MGNMNLIKNINIKCELSNKFDITLRTYNDLLQ